MHIRSELLPLHRSDHGEAEAAAAARVLAGGWLTRGPECAVFESEFAARVGIEPTQALALASGTAALELALRALEIGPGDEVIVPALTFAACANVVVHCGATPVFADVNAATHGLSAATVEPRITPRTRAVMPVHFAGLPGRIAEVRALARARGLAVVEDCAHCVEGTAGGAPVGVAGGADAAAYSFYATKNLSCGEGGLLACADPAVRERAALLSRGGLTSGALERSGQAAPGYDVAAAGFKANWNDLHAAIGRVQLSRLDDNHARRATLMARYAEALAGPALAGRLSLLTEPRAENTSAHHLCVVRLAPELADCRDALMAALRERKVQTALHFPALTGTRFYRDSYGTRPEDTPVAADLAARSLSLPLYPGMEESDAAYVAEALRSALDELA